MGLEGLRKEIEDIDLQILALMRKRLDAAERIGRIKVEENSQVRVPATEAKVIARYRDFAEENGMDQDNAESICRTFMQESIELQAAMPRATGKSRDIAVVGGCGKMGHWFSELFSRAGHHVTVIDPSSDNGLTLRDASEADTVLVSVPISKTADVLRELDGICRDDALIFDISSLKSPLVSTLRDMGSHRKVCSVHPMFGPSAKSMFDRNLVICDCGNDEACDEAMRLLDNHGANMRRMPVEDHDRYMSYVLGLSHAVNIALFTVLARSGIPYDDMSTVASTTFRKLMDSNVSVAMEDPDLYYEIQHLNVNRESVLHEFDRSVEDVVDAALSDDPEKFRELMEKGREYFSE